MSDDFVVSVEEIKKSFIPVLARGGAKKAILFGSYARGEADQQSDIDLLIIAESKRPFIERFKDFSNLWHVSPVKSLDVFVYTIKEFQKMQREKNPFIVKAMVEGKLIYEAEPRPRSGPVAAASRTRLGGE
jgi:predicted nucleotidyltransferase